MLWKGRREPERLGGRGCVEELAVICVVSGRLPVEALFEERLAGESELRSCLAGDRERGRQRGRETGRERQRERSQVRRVPGLFKVAFCFLSPPVFLHSFLLSTKPKIELIH